MSLALGPHAAAGMTSRPSTLFRKVFHFRSTAEPAEFFVSRWLFLRLLGVVYLAAFTSLWVQIEGLIGSQGVLPVADYLGAVQVVTGRERYYLVPTVCWLHSTDPFLCAL